MSQAPKLGELAARFGGRVIGDPELRVTGVASLERAGPTELAFLTNPRYRRAAEATAAGAVLVAPGTELAGRTLLEIAEPYLALAGILDLLYPPSRPVPGISPDARLGREVRLGEAVQVGPFAVIGDRSSIGARAVVGAGVVVGEGCVIGDDTVLAPRVVLYPRSVVGARCLVHAGVVLGADGFGFATSRGVHHKVPQVGRVVVGDDVEIGANAAVDRGAVDDTVVGDGTKIDDLVMVAHGVSLGKGCLLAAQSGIAGSTRVGAYGVFAGQSGSAGHLEIGERTVVAAKTAVFADVPAGSFVAGIPAVDHRQWKRAQAALKKLPELRAELRELRARLEALENRAKGEA
ncbi:MAG TPA: UDP-3-O-(3-hydroxymyristoyl)glucosamine N-acyltransferase [Candidatus Polarisedimenticolaceae bacterium]